MLQTKVHKDIAKYEAQIVMGLTMHSLVALTVGIVLGIAVYFIFHDNFTLAMTTTFLITALGFFNFDRQMFPYIKALLQPSWYYYVKNYSVTMLEMEDSLNVWKKTTEDNKKK